MELKPFLKDVADAIREKTGGTGVIYPGQHHGH